MVVVYTVNTAAVREIVALGNLRALNLECS